MSGHVSPEQAVTFKRNGRSRWAGICNYRSDCVRLLQRFLDHIEQHERGWVTRRLDIARHWKKIHPFNAETAFIWGKP